MQSESDDDVRKRLFEKPRFELVAKDLFRLGRCYIFRQGVPGLWASDRESTTADGWSLDRWHQKTIGACRTKRPSAGKTVYWHERSKVRRCTSATNSKCPNVSKCTISEKWPEHNKATKTLILMLLYNHTRTYCESSRLVCCRLVFRTFNSRSSHIKSFCSPRSCDSSCFDWSRKCRNCTHWIQTATSLQNLK